MKKFSLLLCLACLGFVAPSSGQTRETSDGATPARQTTLIGRRERYIFSNLLGELTGKTHSVIVCEAAPLKPEVGQRDVDPAVLNRISGDLTPEEAIKAAATLFDYQARKIGENQYLFEKKYTVAEDLPDISYDEILNALQNICKSAARFDPGEGLGPILLEMSKTFTERQQKQAADWLPVSDMTDEQKALAWKFACHFPFTRLDGVNKIVRRLKVYRGNQAFFGYREFYHRDWPIYEGPCGLNGAMWFSVLSRWVNTFAGGGTGFEGGKEAHLEDGKIVSNIMEPTTPLPNALALPERPSGVPLMEFVRQVNTSLKGEKPFEVKPTLENKTVTFFGKALTQELLLGYAALQGWQIKEGKATRRIGLPSSRYITDPTLIGTEVMRLIPPPFVRAMHLFDADAGQDDAQYIACVRALRTRLEPRIAAAPGRKLKTKEAPSQVKDLFAQYCLLTLMSELKYLAKASPGYLKYFDNAKIKVILTPGANSRKLEFALAASDGVQTIYSVSGDTTMPNEP